MALSAVSSAFMVGSISNAGAPQLPLQLNTSATSPISTTPCNYSTRSAYKNKMVAVAAARTQLQLATEPEYYDRESDLRAFDATQAGVKGLVDAGVTKVPQIFIRPPENMKASDDPPEFSIPLIDLSGVKDDPIKRKEIVEKVRIASETLGLFNVINHGIPDDVLAEMLEGTLRFHEQDTEDKKQWYSRDGAKRFYYNSNFDLYSGVVTNWRDTFSSMMAPDFPDSRELPSVCRDILIEYAKEMRNLGDTMFELFSEGLGLDPNHLNNMECNKGFGLIGHYYPACPEPELTIGAGKHADKSFLTVLLQDNIGGLQVLHQNKWFDATPIPGALVVNVGDLLQLISNGKFKSNEHRVLSNRVGPRVSVAGFFCTNLIPSAKVYGPIKELVSEYNPPKYKEIKVEEYMKHFNAKGLDDISPLLPFRV